MKTVGTRMKRIDAPAKLTGVERFTGDMRPRGLLHARLVGAMNAHSLIRGVDKTAALAIPGVVAVLTADDLPISLDASGRPHKTPIAHGESLYVGHPVALVLADSEAAAEDGAAAVFIDEEEMPSIVTLDQAMDFASPPMRSQAAAGGEEEAGMHNADAAQHTGTEEVKLPPNVANSSHFTRGDVNAGFAGAAEIVELTFGSLTVHQGYLETQACMVEIDPLGDISVYTSTQASFYCRTRVAETVGVPVHRVKVVPMPVGGGFGGKFVLIEPLVAAAAVAVNRPVLLQYTRMEDFVAANPAPDCRISLRVGAKADGTLTALQSEVIFDSGAGGMAPMEISAILMGGYYRVPNLDIRGYAVLTHKAGGGAYRAPGAQQGSFAIESVMDELAHKLGIDPIALRLKNCVVEGDLRPNGSPWPRIGLKETLTALQKHPAWKNRAAAQKAGHGFGVAVGGWPGGVEPAAAVCRLDQDGTITVVLGSVDLSGTNTTFSQIAAEAFGIDHGSVRITTADTTSAPYAGGTGGSKITYTMGPVVKQAAEEARKQVLQIAAQHLEASAKDLEITNGQVQVKGVPSSAVSLKQIAQMSMSFGAKYAPVYGAGQNAITDTAPGFAVHLVEVSIDRETGEIDVERYVAAQDVGFAINPALVESQIHGAVVQGLGWALHEGLQFDSDGQPLNPSFMDYVMPKAPMAPAIETLLVEVPSVHGAYGSKGVGEPPAIPGPGAVANAIRDATGVRLTDLPMKPQTLMEKLGYSTAAAD